MSNGEHYDSSRKLKVDEYNQFHMLLPNGEKKVIKLSDSEIYTIENWIHLIGKHKLRLEIMNILQIYDELNITQLSQKVEQSKSTVARHLKSLEKHGIVISRKAKVDEYEVGKIPPKIYRRNLKLIEILQYAASLVPPPDNEEELREFYRKQINATRNSFGFFKWLLEKLDPLLDKFEGQLDDISKARETWEKYFDEETTPAYVGIDGRSFSSKYYDQIMRAYKEFFQKFIEILAAQNADPDAGVRDNTAIFAFLPVRDLFEIYKEEVLDKKKNGQ